MFFNRIVAVAICASTALALVVEERAPSQDPALAPLADIPAACQEKCAVLQTYANIDPANLSTLTPVCNRAAQDSFGECIICFEAEKPEVFTPELLGAIQNAADSIGTGCLLVGSPIESLPIPTPTATGSGSSNPTGNSSGTVTQTSATTAPASNSGAQGWSNKLSEAGLIALAAAFGMVAFL
ncbi:hypothetical protein CPB86DRAFT_292147 [Serendipita vermifera]|nr:hypothetical protein CPB86DRAFT_292147 [Serendipita vermifera]